MGRIICIIDMQNDFINGSLGTPEAQVAVKNAIKWLKDNITDRDVIFMTRDTHYNNYLETPEGKRLPVKHCIKKTDGWEIQKELFRIAKEHLIEIYDKSVFGCRDMVEEVVNYIRSRNSRDNIEIIFMGFCTDICVISNGLMVKEALGDLDIPVKVLANCCAGVTPQKHEAALEVMRSCQIDII